VSDEDAFRGYVKLDWLYFGRYNRLHAPADYDVDEFNWRAENVTLACGRHTATAWIPGVFSRMETPRCAQCCDALGLPRGVGSPKNDDECRVLLGLPVKEES